MYNSYSDTKLITLWDTRLFPLEEKHNFNFQIFYDDPGQESVTLGHVHQGKLHLAQISLTYNPPQKKGKFRKVAFLLGKSVVSKSLRRSSGKTEVMFL